MQKIVVIIAIASLASLAGCGKKDEGKSAGKPSEGKPTAAQPAPAEPAPAPPAAEKKEARKLTAPEFFAHYSSLSGMEVLDAYADGVVVSGTVLRTITEMDESLAVWLDAGDGKWVSLTFVDKGAAAKAKGVKEGDTLEAKCTVGGMDVKYIMNIDCELR
jgi:predicted small lipoprotein YifL